MEGKRILSSISRCVLLIGITLIALVGAYFGVYMGSTFLYLFFDFKVTTPLATKAVILAFPFACGAILWLLLAKEKWENKIVTLIVNITSIVLLVPALIAVYFFGVFFPIHRLAQVN